MCVCVGAGVQLCVAVLSESPCAVAVTLTVLLVRALRVSDIHECLYV